jgi:cytochrome P450
VDESVAAILALVVAPLETFLPFLKRLPTPKRRRFERGVAKLDAIIYGMIEQRRASNVETNDLLSLLLSARDEDGSRMSNVQLRDECMTVFLAGHETTAIALSWTWFLLSKHEGIRRKLEDELDAVLGDRRATAADVPALRYTGNVIAESLRLYPPAWSMGREAIDALELGGFSIQPRENVWFCPWSIQRDKRWFEEPDSFRPERWEGDLHKRLPRYAYFPFGGGPRLCIGQSFAQMEAALVLATLARRFRADVTETPIPSPSVTLRPKRGVRARLSSRAR